MKTPFKWDHYSDQPSIITDKNFKKQMRKKEWFSLVKTLLLALFMLPVATLITPFAKRKPFMSKHFFTLGIDPLHHPEATLKMVEELKLNSVLIRVKLWEMEQLTTIKEFLQQLPQDIHVTLKIMQDREHIEDKELLKKDLTTIFTHLKADIYEIGTTINRAKWGFFSVNEYLGFYQVAYTLKEKSFNDITLIGSGVIDFEFHYTLHTLFNFCRCRYDGVSSLLYVDRRGAPEHTQLGFALMDKISLLSALVSISPKTKKHIYITETNYPLENTAPYAPTSEYECISEAEYANFMLRYYLLAYATQQVDFVSWHQLIAAGYGLVDSRNDTLRKREAYFVYMYMLKTLQNAQFLRLDIKRDYYILQCMAEGEQHIQIHWSLKETKLQYEEYFIAYDKTGKELPKSSSITIGASPVYLFITQSVGKKVNAL